MMRKYFDKNGQIIRAGMFIHCGDGNYEEVFACSTDGIEDDDLGINASNYESIAFRQQDYYPLSNFDLSEWEIGFDLSEWEIGKDGRLVKEEH